MSWCIERPSTNLHHCCGHLMGRHTGNQKVVQQSTGAGVGEGINWRVFNRCPVFSSKTNNGISHKSK